MPARKNGATIRDVAELAGTSSATVSRVMQDNGYPVAEELRQRVYEAVKTLQYEPRPMLRSRVKLSDIAESLPTPKAIGVLLPNTTNPFYQQAMLGIERVAQSKGYFAFTCNTMRDVARERDYLEMMYQQGIYYVIISPVSSDPTNIAAYRKKGVHFVLLEQKVDGMEASRIHFDMLKGAIMATRHLIENGHKRIALATTPLTRWTRMQVYNGYKTALEQAGIGVDERLIFIASDKEQESVEVGYDYIAGSELGGILAAHKDEYTGIVCVNDITTAGLMMALKMANISIPEEVSLVSFDDIPLATIMLPKLTTVHFPTYDAGMLAANLLFDLKEGITKFPLTMKLEPTLMIRDTVRPID